MKKLEDISKKEIFNVPDGYFEKLPGIIQARIGDERSERTVTSVFAYSLRFALPAIFLFAIGIFWFTRSDQTVSAESILASIETEDLVAYLSEVELTTDELLENASLDAEDAMGIEDAVYELNVDEGDFDDILDEIDFNSL